MHANVTYRLLNTSSFHPFGFKSLARKLCYFPGLVSTGLWLYNISVARISGLLEHQQNFIAFSNSPRKRRHKLHLGKHDLFHFFFATYCFLQTADQLSRVFQVLIPTLRLPVRDGRPNRHPMFCLLACNCILQAISSPPNEAGSRKVSKIQKWSVLHNVIVVVVCFFPLLVE